MTKQELAKRILDRSARATVEISTAFNDVVDHFDIAVLQDIISDWMYWQGADWFDDCDGGKGIRTEPDGQITAWVGDEGVGNDVKVTDHGGIAHVLTQVMDGYQVWAKAQRKRENEVVPGLWPDED